MILSRFKTQASVRIAQKCYSDQFSIEEVLFVPHSLTELLTMMVPREARVGLPLLYGLSGHSAGDKYEAETVAYTTTNADLTRMAIRCT